ncbi:MAG: protein translocase subunit SecD [Tepidisphaerales bacterium]
MQQGKNLPQRFTLILIVLFGGLWAIFPHWWRLDLKPNLKPGIDISGGSSLVYQITPQEGVKAANDLSTVVANSLKRRVDPHGVKNLIWRPLGATQLEIQMPLSADADKAAAKRNALSQAQKAVDDTNVYAKEVLAALNMTDAAQREKTLTDLAMGSKHRSELFAQLQTARGQLDAATKADDPVKKAAARADLTRIEGQIEETNIAPDRLKATLDLFQDAMDKAEAAGNTKGAADKFKERNEKLAAFRANADFPARLKAVDEYIAAYDEYAKMRRSVSDTEELKRMLRGSGVLTFHIMVDDSAETAKMTERLKSDGPAPKKDDTSRWFEVDKPEEFRPAPIAYGGKHWALASITPDQSMVHDARTKPWGLKSAHKSWDQNNNSAVAFTFDPQGGMLFGDLSGGNIQKRLAIMLDDRIISAPNLHSRIETDGQITGTFSEEEIQYLVNTLNAGSLSAKLDEEPIRERTVGPTLGADNLRAGLKACIIGVLVVIAFMIVYYHFSGVVASIAVCMNLVLILGILAMFNATFTLPGIAAFVLTVGMSVDANVLIYERLREEQQRGLSLRLALHNGYDRAFSAILDSNVTTICTSVVLYIWGSEEVKGFGLILAIGIGCSLFTALFVTRAVFDLCIEEFGMKDLGSLPRSIPWWGRMLHPNVDWMSKAWMFWTGSILIITMGLVAFFHKGRDMWDIEFVSGTSVEIELDQAKMELAAKKAGHPFTIQDLRDRLGKKEFEKDLFATVVAVGNAGTNFEVVSPNSDSKTVRSLVMKSLQDVLKVEPKSTFDHSGVPNIDNVVGKVVLPITGEDLPSVEGFPIQQQARRVARHNGGVLVVLRNIDPQLSEDNLRERLNRGKDELGITATFEVVGNAAKTTDPCSAAIVLAHDPNPDAALRADYTKDPDRWKSDLAEKIWRLANESLGRDAELRRVTRFDAQVADAMKIDASIAVTISVVVIGVYLWVRFANVKFGTATVVALFHDMMITVGFIGLSQYLSAGILRDWFLIEPLRVNLTLVAAVLTVMGYSVADTIIVFDRIRENRGKYGFISRQIINDSINQTLSRTLLTTGLTLLTVLVMYLFGGPGIHGFTFALLAGIFVGSYSSIAIAAPMLLWSGSDVRSDDSTPAGKLPAVVKK